MNDLKKLLSDEKHLSAVDLRSSPLTRARLSSGSRRPWRGIFTGVIAN
jgi:hypothetical protein